MNDTGENGQLNDADKNGEPFTIEQLAQKAEVSVETARVFWRTLGFPQPGESEELFTEDDVTALRQASSWVDQGMLDQRGAISIGRSIAHTSERLVLWQVEAIVDDVARRLSVDDTSARMMALQRIEDFRSAFESQIVYAWRRHLDALLERTATEVAEARSSSVSPRALPLERAIGFADLTSSTEYLVQLGPEELASFVQRFESIARDVISTAGARVVKTIGDAVLFVADTPEIGAEVALSLRKAIDRADDVPPVRIGMVWGRLLSRFGDVFGPPVNLAARLTDIAEPGTILVDQTTANELVKIGQSSGKEFVLEVLPERELRGIGTLKPLQLSQRDGL